MCIRFHRLGRTAAGGGRGLDHLTPGGYRGDLGIRVDPGIFCVGDQPLDPPALDLVRRPRSLIPAAVSRAPVHEAQKPALAPPNLSMGPQLSKTAPKPARREAKP